MIFIKNSPPRTNIERIVQILSKARAARLGYDQCCSHEREFNYRDTSMTETRFTQAWYQALTLHLLKEDATLRTQLLQGLDMLDFRNMSEVIFRIARCRQLLCISKMNIGVLCLEPSADIGNETPLGYHSYDPSWETTLSHVRKVYFIYDSYSMCFSVGRSIQHGSGIYPKDFLTPEDMRKLWQEELAAGRWINHFFVDSPFSGQSGIFTRAASLGFSICLRKLRLGLVFR